MAKVACHNEGRWMGIQVFLPFVRLNPWRHKNLQHWPTPRSKILGTSGMQGKSVNGYSLFLWLLKSFNI
jgi:hypothetical protein